MTSVTCGKLCLIPTKRSQKGNQLPFPLPSSRAPFFHHSLIGCTSLICICKFGAKFLIIVYCSNSTAIRRSNGHAEERLRSKQYYDTTKLQSKTRGWMEIFLIFLICIFTHRQVLIFCDYVQSSIA